MPRSLILSAFVLAVASGCTSSSIDTAAGPYEGIYRVTSNTANPHACSPGPEVAHGEEYAIAWIRGHGLFTSLAVMSCSSPDECRERAAQFDRGEGILAELMEEATTAADGELRGETASTGYADGTTCSSPELVHVSMRLEGTTLTISREHVTTDELPAVDGLCSTERTQRALEGMPCTGLDLVVAERNEDL